MTFSRPEILALHGIGCYPPRVYRRDRDHALNSLQRESWRGRDADVARIERLRKEQFGMLESGVLQ